MGTVKVKMMVDGEERETEVSVSDLLGLERRERKSVSSFQLKLMWSAGCTLIGALLWMGVMDTVERIKKLERTSQELQIGAAENRVAYGQIMSAIGEIKADMKGHMATSQEKPR